MFICCSATIGNPHELARRILEQDVTLIDENGAPSGERHFVLYNPPLVDRVQGIRRSVVLESQRIATRLLKMGVKTIVFARSRVRTELIATYIRDSLKSFYTDNHGITVQSYRGGYLPNERRAIEKGLRDGSIQGVVSTNALELGIDIGGLDASVLAGFPGTIASSWQQAGRAGRRDTVSLSILVASSSPTDQFVIQHPEYFFSRSPENGYIDPGQHLHPDRPAEVRGLRAALRGRGELRRGLARPAGLPCGEGGASGTRAGSGTGRTAPTPRRTCPCAPPRRRTW